MMVGRNNKATNFFAVRLANLRKIGQVAFFFFIILRNLNFCSHSDADSERFIISTAEKSKHHVNYRRPAKKSRG